MREANYTFEIHCHRLAAWAASRAYSRGLRGASVGWTFDLLQKVGLDENFSIKSLPPDRDRFDKEHHRLCEAIMDASGSRIKFFGRAAKLLNAYFKVRFVCGPYHDKPVVRLMHPPVDRLLLLRLGECEKIPDGERRQWRKNARMGWSKFDHDTYRKVISLIRKRVGDKPPWTIEQYWDGHRI